MFEWRDYLALATSLATPQPAAASGQAAGVQAAASVPDEASMRTAVSRAYYAALHEAWDYVAKNMPTVPLPTVGGGTHEAVWKALANGQRRQEKSASVHGFALKGKRTKADYELDGLSFPRDATFAIQTAAAVIASLGAARRAGGPR